MKGKVYVIRDKELEMFTIGTLSYKLDRQAQTLYKWEEKGIIPKAIYRDGSKRRLYTKNQIFAIEACVKKYDIKQGVAIPKEFVKEVHELFERATQMDFEENPVS